MSYQQESESTLVTEQPGPPTTALSDAEGRPPGRPQPDPAILADIERFETLLRAYLEGGLPEDVFRVVRLNNGVYGQRQGGSNHMVRVKVPYGRLDPDQLQMLGWIADHYSRGWGHITTRQNIQFHFVSLERVPDVMRDLAAVGLTTREACGDTVRNIQGCPLAGACPYEVLDVSPWAEAAFRHFLRHPYAQRLPRKFKINFSGCATDCGQAMFNDVGVVAVTRRGADGGLERGFRVFIAGGLGANPHPAFPLEEFTPTEELLLTLEACLRTFDHYGNRENKLRARMKWLADAIGADELRRRILTERRLLRAAAGAPIGIPEVVRERGDDPAGMAEGRPPTPMGDGVVVSIRSTDPFHRWREANVVEGAAKGTISAYAHCPLGDVTGDQFRGLAEIQRDFRLEVRVTNRQNVVFRGVRPEDLHRLWERLDALGLARPGAELARDVVACPGADTCNLAVTQSRGLAAAIAARLEEEGLAEVGGVRINISGCANSCGQHHVADLGFFGLERRAHGRSAPGYQMLMGGHLAQAGVVFGERLVRLPAKRAPEAAVRVVGRYAAERRPGEAFREWLDRVGGPKALRPELAQLDFLPPPDQAPDFYVDYAETGPYVKQVGESECAT